MKKPISPKLHGLIDSSPAAATAAAPRLFRFPRTAAVAAETVAAAYSGMAGATKRLPWRVHGRTDAVLGAVLPAVPWLLGFSRHRKARNFFLVLGAVSLIVAVLTDWSAEPGTGKPATE